MEDDDRTKKQQYLRHEIIEATGELITGQDVFKKFESKDFKAKNSNIPVVVEFKNTSSSVLTYFFMDDEKKKSGLTKLIPASFGTMNTFVSAPWVIEGPQGLIATYTPSMDVKDGEKITVTTDKQFATTVKKDVSKFINFMAEERQDGDDIEQWEMEEQKEMVQKYKNLGQNSIVTELCKYNIKPSEINALSMIVDCPNTLKPTDMLLKNVDVRITGTREMKAGTFKKDYVVYQIKTLPYDWIVERRYSEFEWLREVLDIDFPFTFVPPIPDKELASKSEDVVAKRKNWMQLFLNSIVDHPELKSTLHVQGFLRLSDAASYESFKKQISDSSMKQRNLVERYKKDGLNLFDGEKGMKAGEFSTLSTKANCDVLPTYTIFMQELTKYIGATAPQYRKVGELSHKMVEAVDNLKNVSQELSSVYKELQIVTKKFNESSPFGIAETLEHAYSTSANIFMNWSNNLERRTNVIRDTVVNLVEYSKKELDVAAENIIFRNKLGNDFVDYYKKLHTEKGKLFKSKNISEWKLTPEVHNHIPNNTLLNDEELAKALILPDRTKSLKNMHVIFGFVNNRIVTEWDQMVNFKTRRFLSTLEEFSNRSHELSDEENNIFNELGNGMRNFAKEIKPPPAYYDEDDARRLHNILTCSG